ncbi:MAG: helix-turn-helix domain-containing protein [Candidatus Thermoplasmatota archaeon]
MSRLREFGLSEYATRAYLALLDLGVTEARDVSARSKVPQAKIYHVLEHLHEKGLVVILAEFPKKYAPVPFHEFLDRLHDEHDRAAEAIARDREVLADMFRVMGDTEVGNRGFFTVIRGRRNVMSKLAEMLNEAKTDFFVVGTSGMTSRHTALMSELQGASSRGVRLRGLIPLTPHTMSRTERLSALMEIRARDIDEGDHDSRVAIVVVDGQRAFLINFLPDDDSVHVGKDVGVFTDQEAMVATLDALVEPHWAKATPLRARHEEIATGRMVESTSILVTQEGSLASFGASFSRGVREMRVFDPQPTSSSGPRVLALAKRVRDLGAQYRAVLNVTNVEVARSLVSLLDASPGSEIRHFESRAPTRFWSLDDREAFIEFSPVLDTSETGFLVHTTSPQALRSLRAQFEDVWARAAPLTERLDELGSAEHASLAAPLSSDDLTRLEVRESTSVKKGPHSRQV